MAINYTYPVKAVPTVSDNVLIIDNEDTTNPRSTKTATIQSIVNLASGGGGGGVSSLNTLTGALTLVGGTSITAVSSGGDTITINLEIEQDLELGAYNITSNSGVRNGLVNIVSGGTGGITLNPATGYVTIDQNTWPNADGSAGQVLITSGSGLLSWSTLSTVTPGGSTTQVQFNDSGAFAGEAAFTYDAAQNKLRADQMDSNLSTAKQFTTGTSSITSSGGAATWDAAQGAYGEFLLTENTTLAITNLPVGTPAVLKVTQDGASSFNITAYTVGGGAVKFPGGTVPTITAAVNSVDIISFIADATDIYASANQDFK